MEIHWFADSQTSKFDFKLERRRCLPFPKGAAAPSFPPLALPIPSSLTTLGELSRLHPFPPMSSDSHPYGFRPLLHNLEKTLLRVDSSSAVFDHGILRLSSAKVHDFQIGDFQLLPRALR